MACSACTQPSVVSGTTKDATTSDNAEGTLVGYQCVGNFIFETGLSTFFRQCQSGVWVPTTLPRCVDATHVTPSTTTAARTTTISTTTTTGPWPFTTGPRKPTGKTPPPDPCLSSPCENNATCIASNGVFQCHCLSTAAGGRCDVLVSGKCETVNCGDGSTGCYYRLTGGIYCECGSGFEGAKCQTNINECISNPCHHGSACQDAVDAFICSCPRGWTGPQCEFDVEECASQPCRSGGSCHETTPGLYLCVCTAGFTGVSCETNINDCEHHSCKNNAYCKDGIGNYTCECLSQYSGTHCETRSQALATVQRTATSFGVVAIIAVAALYGMMVAMDASKCCCKEQFAGARRRRTENNKKPKKPKKPNEPKDPPEPNESNEATKPKPKNHKKSQKPKKLKKPKKANAEDKLPILPKDLGDLTIVELEDEIAPPQPKEESTLDQAENKTTLDTPKEEIFFSHEQTRKETQSKNAATPDQTEENPEFDLAEEQTVVDQVEEAKQEDAGDQVEEKHEADQAEDEDGAASKAEADLAVEKNEGNQAAEEGEANQAKEECEGDQAKKDTVPDQEELNHAEDNSVVDEGEGEAAPNLPKDSDFSKNETAHGETAEIPLSTVSV